MAHSEFKGRKMTFTPLKSASAKKNDILNTCYQHLYPGRVTKMLEGGIDFVPGKREGYIFEDVDGRELLDLHINGGTFSLGHRNPRLVSVLQESLQHLDIGNHHFCSEPKAKLAKALIEQTPGNMQYVVLTASASEANDMAIKSARFATNRRKVVALDVAFHGRSGLSGAGGDDETAKFFKSDYPDEFIKVPFNDLAAMEQALIGGDVALVMMETIPATYGFAMPDDDYLPGVKKLCEKYGSLYLADEVQTGLGRTGNLWGVDVWGIEPDMLVTGKGLSGGLYPVAGLVLNEKAGHWLKENGWGNVSTFGGSDLGCTVALEVLNMCSSEETLSNVKTQAKYLREGLERIKPRFPFFTEIRQQGLVMGLKFSDTTTAYGMMRAMYENGIWAMISGFDETVMQFKPGLLVDKAFCDEVLKRFENACIWLVNNFSELIMGGTVDESEPEIQDIKALAEVAVTQWDLGKVNLKLLKHRENSVFKVTTQDGTRYALRIHRNDYHNVQQLNSELMWMGALNKDGIKTPQVMATKNGKTVLPVSHPRVQGSRHCSLLSWVEGEAFDQLGRVEKGVQKELEERYYRLGAMAAKMHNQSEKWQPPAEFTRHAWDKEGLLGDEPLWGRFWQHPVLKPKQKDMILKARLVLQELLKDLGQGKDCYGLIHADFLPENILVNKGELHLIDFDDCGYGWHLFEMATSLLPQADQPFFDELVSQYVAGYRTERTLSQEHVEILPAFIMIRVFTYLGWLNTRTSSFKNGDKIATKLADALMTYIPQLLEQLTPVQRAAIEVLHLSNKIKGSVAGVFSS